MHPKQEKNLPRSLRRTNSLMRHAAAYTLAAVIQCSSAISAPHIPPDSSIALDAQVAATLSLIARGDLPRARILARQMARRFPDFALGQLLSADLESAAGFNDVLFGDTAFINQPIMELMLEAQARLPDSSGTTPDQPDRQSSSALPDSVIQVGKHTKDLLLVDLQDSRLYHIAGSDSASTLIRQYYVGSGKAGFGKQVEGDNKTPLGTYTITGLRSDASLPDLYGSGALMLDYPNALDRHLGRTGSGIWLHGVPHAQRSRSPRSSEGCVTMSNDHLSTLKNQIAPSETLVILAETVEWTDSATRHSRQSEFQQLFLRFQQGWTKSNREALLGLYRDEAALDRHVLAKGGYQLPIRQPHTAEQALGFEMSQGTSRRFLSQFASVSKHDVSIVANQILPQSGIEDPSRYVVMQVRFGQFDEHQMTLYWTQDNADNWRIAVEQWEGLDI